MREWFLVVGFWFKGKSKREGLIEEHNNIV
jgi:hypothetical protein